jgi:hemerythrin-like domain-containing protein
MDALELLRSDHELVKGIVDELEKTTERAEKTREELFGRLRRNLEAHEKIEEEIFYPALEQHPKAKDMVLEGYVEHDVVERLMGELGGLPVDDEMWGPKAQVMIENLRHHIEEEEGELFKKARQVFDKNELEELGEELSRRKSELLDEADRNVRSGARS